VEYRGRPGIVVRMRTNRFQVSVCLDILSAAFDPATARAMLESAHAMAIPATLPSGPRDLAALSRELQPFVDVYRALQLRVPHEQAIALIRQCIIDSGAVSHAATSESAPSAQSQPLNLTSPPAPGFSLPPDELAARFDTAMQFFSCEGELEHYTPERVRFFVTECNWCEAMRRAKAPELIPIFCETDERFMDDHPTHKLIRPTAIGLGDKRCDFQFVARTEHAEQ
jgi:L-2-amino-thiazoline-4-carboxylic acid hydrolase